MSNAVADPGRRRVLTLATSGVGAIGVGAVLWPFLASMKPSERARALGAPVIADVSQLEAGQKVTYPWRGKPVWVVRRTPEMIESLERVAGDLRDPESEQPQQPSYVSGHARAIKPELLVMIGSCTHLGCSPTFRPDYPAPEIAADWQGGFYCPCHGSKFDVSGRVYKGVPAPTNMVIPPHRYENDTTIVIGEDPQTA